ncbi:MAG: AMP-binding protein, partial [Chloroflexales bacterium]|nr:AMP-binding protein [Chloroflexales bacterium]
MSEAQPPDRPWLAHYSPHVPAALPAPALTAIDQFRASVARAPTSPAIHYFDTTLSYGDLDRLSSALAAALCRSGVWRGDRVALDLQNMPQFWIALLASWKAGAIVVPLNPMFKAAELEYHLNDSGAAALISLESRYATLGHEVVPRTSVRLVITTCELDLLHDDRRPAVLAGVDRARLPGTDDLLALCEQYAGAADPQTAVELHDTAPLTYTSGTTGQPKGAMNSHSNVAANAEVYRTWANLGPGDVIIGMAPLFHITGLVSHLATAGLAGLPLILAYRFDAGELLRLIERWRGSFTVAAITAFVALMNHPSIHERDLSSLRKAYSGGAPIPPALVERFQSLTGT